MTEAERIAAHEAGHACAAVILGVSVTLVDVVGDATRGGWVEHGLGHVRSPDDAEKRMLIILAGCIEGADHWDDVPSWPLQTHRSTDEYNLDALADYLGLDEQGYKQVTTDALGLTLLPEYQMLHVAVTGMLGYFPRIGELMVRRLERLARESREH